ncbi:MAG: hypothetical protein S4CHLAM123_04940 [Chlamydiales bacterium]|nr:hypothetical protein [Chlamydiales bacterium]
MTQQTRSPISFATYLINTKQELHHAGQKGSKTDASLSCSMVSFMKNAFIFSAKELTLAKLGQLGIR